MYLIFVLKYNIYFIEIFIVCFLFYKNNIFFIYPPHLSTLLFIKVYSKYYNFLFMNSKSCIEWYHPIHSNVYSLLNYRDEEIA